ncbi:MAG: hypothetical protein CL927_05170 [Deltaproteobacteria bacterium]|nr:hypothetical protein [Deltaproteobacteria bacterium]HCH61994.1 hypothetical protein [Deltaproteobacteria bacterium]
MGDISAPLQQIRSLRAAAASGRPEDMRGALEGMAPVVAQVGQALVAADRGDWDRVVRMLAGVSDVPWALDGLVSLALTRALTHTEQLELAERIANARLRRAPDDLDVRAERALAWFRAGQVDQARGEFELIVEQLPAHPGALLGLGEIALAGGQLADAAEHLQAACVAAPLAVEPVVALAQLFLVAGRPADGARQVEALVAVGHRQNDPRLLSSLAELHIAAAELDKVIPLLDGLGLQNPANDMQRIELARLWAETGHATPIRALAEQSGMGARALLCAIAARLEGTDPLPHLDEAAIHLPDHWWVHEQRASVFLDSGDLVSAQSAASAARRLAPRAAATRVVAAAVLVQQQEHVGAFRLLRVAAGHAGLWPSVRARARWALTRAGTAASSL